MNDQLAVLTSLLLSFGSFSSAETAPPAGPDQVEATAGNQDQFAKLTGRAAIIGPNGQRQEFSFGDPTGERLKQAIEHGGAHLELKLAPDSEALRILRAELEEIVKSHGVGRKLFEKALGAIPKIDALGDVQLRGLVVGPDDKTWRLELGDDLADEPRKFEQKMENGGAQLELGVVPGPALLNLLTLASHAPEALRLLQFGIENPDKLALLDRAMQDPNLLLLLEKAMQDPQANGLLQKALQNPALTELLAGQLAGGNAGKLLGLLGNSPKPAAPAQPETPPAAPEGSPTAPQPDDGGIKASGHDAELNALREELAAQRALLDKILEKLGSE